MTTELFYHDSLLHFYGTASLFLPFGANVVLLVPKLAFLTENKKKDPMDVLHWSVVIVSLACLGENQGHSDTGSS